MLESWIEARADEMAALVENLVRIPTENPPGRELERCAHVLVEAMDQLGFSPELVDGIVRGSVGDGEVVYYHGHFDVVPAQSPSQFEPSRHDGRIIGRGTSDMKGGLVSMLYGAAAARELGMLDGRRVVFHFVPDEETGSTAGGAYLREAGLIDPGAVAMLTAEPTGGAIWHASRGAITLRVRIAGREAHVGNAHEGVNAFEHMMRIAAPLIELSHDVPALVVGGQSGSGAGFNVVPGSAWFSVDFRFDGDLDAELERLTGMIEDAEIDVLQQQPSASTEPDHPAARALARCVEQVEGASRFELCPGVLETRWYAQLGIPAFAYGGGGLDVAHGPAEYIDEAAMRRCAAVYALLPAAAGR